MQDLLNVSITKAFLSNIGLLHVLWTIPVTRYKPRKWNLTAFSWWVRNS